MDFDELKTELNIRLGDTDNFALTSETKASNLTEAINDADVVTEVWDESLTFTPTTYQYVKPNGVDRLTEIYIRRTNASDSEPEPIDGKYWEIVDGKIHFKSGANDAIPSGYTLYIKGKTKYTTSDTITEINVQEFVLNLAQLHCLTALLLRKTFKFLKNDATVSEIVATKRELERKVAQYRQRLPRAFEGA